MIQTAFHIQVHTALASGHVQVGKQLTSQTTILLLQAQAIEKQKRIQTKAKHVIFNKKKEEKKLFKLTKEAKRKQKWTQINLFLQEDKKDKGAEQTCCNPQYLHTNYR